MNCTACGKWVHKRCSGLTGSLNVVGFECSRCVHGNTREAAEVKKEIELDGDTNVECVAKFFIFEIPWVLGEGQKRHQKQECGVRGPSLENCHHF